MIILESTKNILNYLQDYLQQREKSRNFAPKVDMMDVNKKSEIISLLSDVNREGISSVISYLHQSVYFTTGSEIEYINEA